jgi:hypothetical protein
MRFYRQVAQRDDCSLAPLAIGRRIPRLLPLRDQESEREKDGVVVVNVFVVARTIRHDDCGDNSVVKNKECDVIAVDVVVENALSLIFLMMLLLLLLCSRLLCLLPPPRA